MSSGQHGGSEVAGLERVAEQLVRDHSLVDVRERHLSDAFKEQFGLQLGADVHTKVLRVPDWPKLGRSGVDIVVDDPRSGRPWWVAELKWCQLGQDKVYEAIWDLFKVALLSREPGVEWAHLVTGAPVGLWPAAVCGDIFLGGTFTPEDLCARRFKSGARRLAWDDLLGGGYDRHPDHVPSEVVTEYLAPVPIEDASGAWELRAVRVSVPADAGRVPFRAGWPYGRRPGDARRPG